MTRARQLSVLRITQSMRDLVSEQTRCNTVILFSAGLAGWRAFYLGISQQTRVSTRFFGSTTQISYSDKTSFIGDSMAGLVWMKIGEKEGNGRSEEGVGEEPVLEFLVCHVPHPSWYEHVGPQPESSKQTHTSACLIVWNV